MSGDKSTSPAGETPPADHRQRKATQQDGTPNHHTPRISKPQKGPAVPVGRNSDRPPPRCDSTREKNVFDQNRRMGRKAGHKPPPREVLRNRRFLSQFLGTFVWRQKYLARRRNTPSRLPTKKSYPTEHRANSPHPTRPRTTKRVRRCWSGETWSDHLQGATARGRSVCSTKTAGWEEKQVSSHHPGKSLETAGF